jgi:hypothetical protein
LWDEKWRNLPELAAAGQGLGRVYYSLIHQQDRDLIPDGVHAMALAALESFSVVLEREALVADGTGQNFQQIG